MGGPIPRYTSEVYVGAGADWYHILREDGLTVTVEENGDGKIQEGDDRITARQLTLKRGSEVAVPEAFRKYRNLAQSAVTECWQNNPTAFGRRAKGISPCQQGARFGDAERADVLLKDFEAIYRRDSVIRSVSVKPGVRVRPGEFFLRYGKALGLRFDKGDSLKETKTFQDKLGCTHRWFQQTYYDVPVIAASCQLVERDGDVTYASIDVIRDLDLPTTPKITEDDALTDAAAAVGISRPYPWESDPANYQVPRGTLAIGSKNYAMTAEGTRLVWGFPITSSEPPRSYTVEIDATTGEVVNVVNNRIK